MKHATSTTLDTLTDLLDELRRRTLRERKIGVFYRGSRAFLHFHEDPTGIFADVRLGEDFTRVPVSTPRQQRALLAAVDRVLGPAAIERGKR
jgi:hypothetical protein